MANTNSNTLFLLHLLSILSCKAITVHSLPPAEAPHAQPPHHHHHHHHAPTPSPTHPPVKPPVHPPVYPPVKPPVHPPVKPPVHPPIKPPVKPPVYPPVKPPVKPPSYPPKRKLVAVQGVVYCKSCKYRGVDTLMGASPLLGAVVKLQCNNSKYPLREQTKTDKNGYFFFMPQKLTTSGSHKCKVYLGSSPKPTCAVPTSFHGGSAGAPLIPAAPISNHTDAKYLLFNVGPFAFEPRKKLPCHY